MLTMVLVIIEAPDVDLNPASYPQFNAVMPYAYRVSTVKLYVVSAGDSVNGCTGFRKPRLLATFTSSMQGPLTATIAVVRGTRTSS